ncbi:MAG: HAD-IC family P-type ATPase, partial [Clostridia bacterium]|nr:HAD-IC family P-type ATPase [Clostridia bacterium]
MDYYSKDVNTVFADVASTENGLTTAEAEKRLEEHGRNKLAEAKRAGPVKRFLKQLADPMIIILIVAAVLSGVTSVWEGEPPTDVFIILFIVILNSVLGVVQESKAEKAIDALREMTAATSKVMRDGVLVHVKSEELVPGDVIILEAGDAVPADARLIECASLKAEEAALTGESVAVLKDTEPVTGDEVPLGDRTNMVYTGSTVVYGRGRAVVTETGMKTEMGKIADALATARDEATPLQKKLSSLSRILTVAVLAICVFMFVF